MLAVCLLTYFAPFKDIPSQRHFQLMTTDDSSRGGRRARCFAADWWLYGRLGFLRLFGRGDAGGQILRR